MKRIILILILVLGAACQSPKTTKEIDLHKTEARLNEGFKSYWFDGTAEISSFDLEQSRYGSIRKGEAVLIFVTEDFLTQNQVKANSKSNSSKVVLKLNKQKNFLTGIYPYSIMSSSFTYLGWEPHLAKISTSIQEWCGQSYLQLNHKNPMELRSHSYFEGEEDQLTHFPMNTLTEDELWNRIRLQPENLPIGEFTLLPSLELLRLNHLALKTVSASAALKTGDSLSTYEISFPSLGRKLSIHFQKEPPYLIEAWEDESDKGAAFTTKAYRRKTVKLPYWKLNKAGDEQYRTKLNLTPY